MRAHVETIAPQLAAPAVKRAVAFDSIGARFARASL